MHCVYWLLLLTVWKILIHLCMLCGSVLRFSITWCCIVGWVVSDISWEHSALWVIKCRAVHEEWHSNQTPWRLERKVLCSFKTSVTTCPPICHHHPRKPEFCNSCLIVHDHLHCRVCWIQKPVYKALRWTTACSVEERKYPECYRYCYTESSDRDIQPGSWVL